MNNFDHIWANLIPAQQPQPAAQSERKTSEPEKTAAPSGAMSGDKA